MTEEQKRKMEELIAITAKHLPIARKKLAEAAFAPSVAKYHPALLKLSELER